MANSLTLNDLISKIQEATGCYVVADQDNEGQIVLYTGLTLGSDGETLEEMKDA